MMASDRRAGADRRRSADEIADALVGLYGVPFGGRPAGKYRVSRKFLRQLAGRRHLSSRILDDLVEEMNERGFAFIDLETYFAVIEQRMFNSYRRVTAAAADSVVDRPDDG